MASDADILIVGLGAMGSAAACQLARRGLRVTGFDRFAPPHDRGSSHGETRIIREAYFEHPAYVPLVQRAYELWDELQQRAGRQLLRPTGGLMIGPENSVLVGGALRSAREHRLAHEILAARTVRERFPGLHPHADMVAVWEPRAGVLFPEDCIAAHLAEAHAAGAALHLEEPILRWEPDGDGVVVWTERGQYRARRLLLTAGAWVNSLLPGATLPLAVERQVLHWFTPLDAAPYRPDRCPIHIWETAPHNFFYGFPDLGTGVKVALHHQGQPTDADSVDRAVAPGEITAMRALLERFLPGAAGPHRASAACVYTNTPDENFWIDWHPAAPQVLIASPCSGHGFKFSSAIGEVAADLLTGREPRFDLSLFRARKF
jgi:sarcosine oxidase